MQQEAHNTPPVGILGLHDSNRLHGIPIRALRLLNLSRPGLLQLDSSSPLRTSQCLLPLQLQLHLVNLLGLLYKPLGGKSQHHGPEQHAGGTAATVSIRLLHSSGQWRAQPGQTNL